VASGNTRDYFSCGTSCPYLKFKLEWLAVALWATPLEVGHALKISLVMNRVKRVTLIGACLCAHAPLRDLANVRKGCHQCKIGCIPERGGGVVYIYYTGFDSTGCDL
jgi:hypothetical protein